MKIPVKANGENTNVQSVWYPVKSFTDGRLWVDAVQSTKGRSSSASRYMSLGCYSATFHMVVSHQLSGPFCTYMELSDFCFVLLLMETETLCSSLISTLGLVVL